MPNLVNKMTIADLESALEGTEGMLLVSFGGLDMSLTEKIRADLAEKGAGFRMVRNKLAKRVLSGKGLEFDANAFLGNTAIAYGNAEAVIGAAKVLTEKEIKKTKLVAVKGGFLEGQTLDAAGATLLADVPDRDTVNAMLLGVISGPARGIACIINAVPASVARVIQAHADDADGGDSPAADASEG
ncbi:MAG: large subunit ribosomal protein L10 [Planctomycetota bacterium]|jgi:large subunit ribosomal protein L10